MPLLLVLTFYSKERHPYAHRANQPEIAQLPDFAAQSSVFLAITRYHDLYHVKN